MIHPRHRPRLAAASALGFVSFFLLPPGWPFVTRALVAWNAGVWCYLALMGWHMLRASAAQLREIAQQEDASTATMLAVLSAAAMLSVAAIVLELAATRGNSAAQALPHYGLTILTILGSWLLVGVIYTFHYAHLFYSADASSRPLRFPDDPQHPRYIDFLYFSFTISVAAQTADVSVLSSTMRAAVLAQSVLAFLFNVAILGLTINIAAGLVGQ
ncbi:MAG TPA: DUF1345 domain-containing protein [Ramlibacter sp.]|uniref:DUF1345 domain-containing protein n=1 Tax=Ramlibacter sp. TaxID=1917967 RepID=UPI002BBA8D9F|nr:DUF1345 domain-containing protein [Ramlibacter sp.]HVZ43962.1 DUF1345 domain-containing protein [Ramlibacter sp.]